MTAEEMEAMANPVVIGGKDPFAVWPALEDLLDGGEGREGDEGHSIPDSRHHSHHNHGKHGSHVSHHDPHHVEHDEEDDTTVSVSSEQSSYLSPGRVVKITDGGSEAQHVLDSVKPGTTVVVHWDAEWHTEGAGISKRLEAMITNVDALVIHVDIGSHPPNWSFAMEKVMTKPESNRQGAKPVLKDGRKWPCFTVHIAPDLQPVETVAGAHAINSIAKLIASLPAWSGNTIDSTSDGYTRKDGGGRMAARSGAGTSATLVEQHNSMAVISLEDVVGHFPRIANGAIDLREQLKTFAQSKKNLCILWEEDGLPLKLLKALQTIVSRRPEADNLFLADVSVAANSSLGKALGVKKPPTLLIFSNMKLSKKIEGPDRVVEALEQEFRTMAPGVELTPAGISQLARQKHQAASGGGSLYDPPQGKQNRSGATKLTPDGKLVHFFPKMPCLRCGCPWWTSDDWDARCCRCRWDCQQGGYDDDSRPLPQHKDVWQKFVDSIKGGVTPSYASSSKKSGGGRK